MRLIQNEDGSAGFVVWVTISIILIATFWIAGGVVIDFCGDTLNTQIEDPSYYTSQTRVDTFNMATLGYRAIPVVVLITVAILGAIAIYRYRSGTIG